MKTQSLWKSIIVAAGLVALVLTFGDFFGAAEASDTTWEVTCHFNPGGELTGYDCKTGGSYLCMVETCDVHPE